MKKKNSDLQLISYLYFRLLPAQILLVLVAAVNSTISGLFGSNFVGAAVMSALGLYGPINKFLTAVNTVFVGGSQIICGKYMGKNEIEKTQDVFSLDLLAVTGISVLTITVFIVSALTGLTRVLAPDPVMRETLNKYILGQAIGILPMMLGQQLSAFLAFENQSKRTMTASLACIVVNIAANFLFVVVLKMNAFGLALASSLGMWAFFGIQFSYYLSKKSIFKWNHIPTDRSDIQNILKTGYPGALSTGYQTIRGLILNVLIVQYVGSVGLSSFAASDSVMALFWAIPSGMLTVSRMLMSIAIGEEDRKSLADVMRIVMYKCIPLMYCICALIIVCAVPITRLFYRDPADPVYGMTVMAFRLIPLCMPLSIIFMHAVCYGQASGKQILVHVLSLLDGVLCMAVFSALLVPVIQMNGIYIAFTLNGIVCALTILLYSCIQLKKFPKNMEEYMVIPDDFGVGEDDRIDISVREMSEVMSVSQQVIDFCKAHGIDDRRSYFSGLFLEEMAGNVVDHGFSKDNKTHSVDIRVVHKDDDVILRIKDDCVPFDPSERRDLIDSKDRMKNKGISMVYKGAKDILYQNMLGLNVLTIRI